MKRLLLIFGLLFALAAPTFVFSHNASAVDIFTHCDQAGDRAAGTTTPDACQDANTQDANNKTNNPIVKIIKAAIEVVSFTVGAAAIIGVIVSGLRMILAGGDAQAAASARNGLFYSLIGIAVVALAQSIVIFVLNKIK